MLRSKHYVEWVNSNLLQLLSLIFTLFVLTESLSAEIMMMAYEKRVRIAVLNVFTYLTCKLQLTGIKCSFTPTYVGRSRSTVS